MEPQIALAPAAQQEISAVAEKANAMLESARAVAAITDADGEAKAVTFLGQIKNMLGSQEEARTFLVKPLNDHVKAINSAFRDATAPLHEAEGIVRKGINDHRNSEAMKAAEAERDRIAAAAKAAPKSGNAASLPTLQQELKQVEAEAPKTVETKRGQARFKDVLKWEVEDPAKLPAAYLMPDAAKIKRDVMAGLNIAGVRTWHEKEVSVYGARS